MVNDATLEHVYKRAIQLFKSGITQDTLVNTSGKIEKPIPVVDSSGETISWFIGITVGERLVGFMEINSNLELLRYSTFQRTLGLLSGCPMASIWLDTESIINRARTMASTQDELSYPILTYDRSPSRIVWAVKATDKRGQSKTIYVAGEYVYIKDENDAKKRGVTGGKLAEE